jgi:acyl-CoA thioesterase
MKTTEAEAARRVGNLAARDPFAKLVGIECEHGGLGYAKVRLQVRAEHLNFNGSCHGAVIFALADTAFGLASNSYGVIAAGIDAHITYHVPAAAGDVLSATATEVSRSRKLAVYRIDVTRADGMITTAFTGTVYLSSRPTDAPGG